MNKSFMEKSLINKCANILGISVDMVTQMFEMNVEVKTFIQRRISFGIYSAEDNIGYMLKGLLFREKKDFAKIRDYELDFIKTRYGLIMQPTAKKKSEILSEKVDPLILGVVGETLLRDYAKVLGISRKDAVKLIKSNESVKSFMQKEKSLAILERKNTISILLQNTLKRNKDDFSPITNVELAFIYEKYGIKIDKAITKSNVIAING